MDKASPPPLNDVIIAVGSNIQPQLHIARAKAILAAEMQWVDETPLKETRPRGLKNQPNFLNGAFRVRTALSLSPLKERLKAIEALEGRQRTADKNAPRTLDLDVIVFNGIFVNDDYQRYDFVKEAVDALLKNG